MTRIVCTSDFHGFYPPIGEVPECDLLIIAGDFGGSPVEFGDWLAIQPATTIVGTAGNHDAIAKHHDAVVRGLPWTYLHNESTRAAGLRIFGSPLSPPFGNWDFMGPEDELEEAWAKIPADTEVLVVHGPARGILDKTRGGVSAGSVTLRDRLGDLPDLRLLVTGHIHEAYGETRAPILRWVGEVKWLHCVNASWVNERYKPGNPPIAVDLL